MPLFFLVNTLQGTKVYPALKSGAIDEERSNK